MMAHRQKAKKESAVKKMLVRKQTLTDLKMASRNIFRNKRRTFLTLSSIVLGTAALMNFDGYKNYAEWGLRESYIRSQLGHLQVYKKGYKASKGLNPLEFLIKNPDEIKVLIQKTLGDRLKVATPRLELNGLITKGGQSYNFIAQGVEIDGEKKIAESDDGMSTGFIMRRGRQLRNGEVGSAMLGSKLCDALNVAEGDMLSIIGASISGSLNALDLLWQGCFSTISKEYDKVRHNAYRRCKTILRITRCSQNGDHAKRDGDDRKGPQ